MFNIGSVAVESAGISVRIVDFLGKFDSDVPVDFLANQMGIRSENLMEDLRSLQGRDIVQISSDHRKVGLVRKEKKFRFWK